MDHNLPAPGMEVKRIDSGVSFETSTVLLAASVASSVKWKQNWHPPQREVGYGDCQERWPARVARCVNSSVIHLMTLLPEMTGMCVVFVVHFVELALCSFDSMQHELFCL